MQRNRVALAAAVCLAAVSGVAWVLWLAQDSEAPPPVAQEQLAPAAAPPTPPPLARSTVELGRGDTLVGALKRAGLDLPQANALAAALRAAGADLRRLRPGDALAIAREADGRWVEASLPVSPWLRFEARAGESGWTVTRQETAPELRVEVRRGEVVNSLWDAVESGAISAQLLLDLVQIFESEFDFGADTQKGDRFQLLVEACYADGRYVDHGRILAAQYLPADDRRALTGVGYAVGGKFAHYDLEGRSLRKTFLRSPLEFTRISSGYTHRRPHPVLGGVRPHLAIDYAAPTGTPVWAVADGTVEFTGYKGGNGIQVTLRHRAGYVTYYNHLSRIGKGVRRGAGVKQKQVIGYVGSTGLSTGPHLDYRVSKNGTFVNPLQEKFLPGEPIPRAEQARFKAQAEQWLAQLNAPTAVAQAAR